MRLNRRERQQKPCTTIGGQPWRSASDFAERLLCLRTELLGIVIILLIRIGGGGLASDWMESDRLSERRAFSRLRKHSLLGQGMNSVIDADKTAPSILQPNRGVSATC